MEAQYLEPWLSFGQEAQVNPWSNVLRDIYKDIFIFISFFFYTYIDI